MSTLCLVSTYKWPLSEYPAMARFECYLPAQKRQQLSNFVYDNCTGCAAYIGCFHISYLVYLGIVSSNVTLQIPIS